MIWSDLKATSLFIIKTKKLLNESFKDLRISFSLSKAFSKLKFDGD